MQFLRARSSRNPRIAPIQGSMLDDRSILITGGTGSFGRALVKTILARHKPRRLVIFSRDEQKQFRKTQAELIAERENCVAKIFLLCGLVHKCN